MYIKLTKRNDFSFSFMYIRKNVCTYVFYKKDGQGSSAPLYNFRDDEDIIFMIILLYL